MQTDVLSYLDPNLFTTPISNGKGNGFNSSGNRFSNSICQTSKKIDGPGILDRNGGAFSRTQRFSFGVSR